MSNGLKFEIYSYLEQLMWVVLDLMPPFIRRFVFRAVFRRFGHGSLIDYGVYIRYAFKVSIGENTTINRGCQFFGSYHIADVSIVIGNNVAISPEVKFFAAGHDYTDLSLPDTGASIVVGDNAWIGGGATILQGVTIGEGAVIAAGSIVTKDVPPYSLAMGTPAKVKAVRMIVPRAR